MSEDFSSKEFWDSFQKMWNPASFPMPGMFVPTMSVEDVEKKIAELRAAGRMHASGIRAFEERDPRNDQRYSYERPLQEIPDDWLDRFRADAGAWDFWERQSSSFRNMATHWVISAVNPETRERRFATLLDESRAGRRPRPFRVGAD